MVKERELIIFSVAKHLHPVVIFGHITGGEVFSS